MKKSTLVSYRDYLRFLNPEEILEKASDLSSQEKKILDNINQKVAGAESFDAIMDFLFETTKDIFPCDRIAVAFLEDNNRRVVARTARAKYSDLVLKAAYSEGLHGSTLQEILDSNRIRVINNLEAYLASKPSSISTSLIVQEGLRSSLTCPLIIEGRPIGFFFRNAKIPNAYSEHEVLLHVSIAERFSQAVEKAWRIDQLSAANKAYMEMLAFASHELKSPLASISMECEMLLEGYISNSGKQLSESINRMKNQVKTLIENTDDFLALARYEGSQLRMNIVHDVDVISDCIYPALENLSSQISARNLKIAINPEHGIDSISCDPQALRIVFLNLIGNAVKYGVEDGEIKITLSHEQNNFKASVWNSGTGFPSDDKSKLFKRFSRLYLPEYQKIKGSGVGLYLVWQLIDLHNGRIDAA